MFLFVCVYIVAPLTFIGLIAYGWHLGKKKTNEERNSRNAKK